MAATYCEDCGCKVYSGRCTNCHEELYIMDQYYELNMQVPSEDTEFMKSVRKHEKQIANKGNQNGY